MVLSRKVQVVDPRERCKACGQLFIRQPRIISPVCSRKCYWKWLASNEYQYDRFMGLVDKSSECWLWNGTISDRGYGIFARTLDGKRITTFAHRHYWVLENGAIPDDLEVCHNCPGGDNPACVRPSHMFLGTHKENMEDYVAKRLLGTIPTDHHNYGERHCLAKLTEADVFDIFKWYIDGETQASIAIRLGITNQVISDIINSKTWKHLRRPPELTACVAIKRRTGMKKLPARVCKVISERVA